MPPAKKPQDHRKPADEDRFTFDHDGKTYSLPRFGSWSAGLVRRVRKLPDVDATFTILEEVADPETLAAIDAMDLDEFNRLQQDWAEHGGVTLGESGSSST
ncbi:hypothetical protein [Mycolicibacterium sp.]|uniref:hypothetical protein n=1 Tax=Mycolicibacterium sp. TaxID=2320850 RepID=UPI0035602850